MGNPLDGLKGPPARYERENIVDKLLSKEEQELILNKQKSELLENINEYCGITQGDYDMDRCIQLIEKIEKEIGISEYEKKREQFKEIEMHDIREKQYIGGLLSDLAYRNKGDLSKNDIYIKEIDESIRVLEERKNDKFAQGQLGGTSPKEIIPQMIKDHQEKKKDFQDITYLLKILAEKGFQIDTMHQVKTEEGLSALYIENNQGEGFFCIRGTDHFVGTDGDDNISIGMSGSINKQLHDIIDIFEKTIFKDKPITIYGHSLGGYLSLGLMIKYPLQIKEVITYDAPGLPKKQDIGRIINRIFQFTRQYYKLTNIVIGSINIANKQGKRPGNDIKLDSVDVHTLSVINNSLAHMSIKEMEEHADKNAVNEYMQEKERNCNISLKLDRERCEKSLGQMKETFKNNSDILELIESSEEHMDTLELKNQILTYLNAVEISEIDIQELKKKYPKFFQLQGKKALQYTIDEFFESEKNGKKNRGDILGLLSLYQIEQRDYQIKDMRQSDPHDGKGHTILIHSQTGKKIEVVSGGNMKTLSDGEVMIQKVSRGYAFRGKDNFFIPKNEKETLGELTQSIQDMPLKKFKKKYRSYEKKK